MTTSTTHTKRLSAAEWIEPITEASGRMAPLWPLRRFVAVNPFVVLSNKSFAQALGLLENTAGSALALPPDYYAHLFAEGVIAEADLVDAVGEAKSAGRHDSAGPTVEELAEVVRENQWQTRGERLHTFAETVDEVADTRWEVFFRDEISKWCASYYDEGQALWGMPWAGRSLFAAWRCAASLDCNPEAAGLRGFRQVVAKLSDDPAAEIAAAAECLGIPAAGAVDVFHCELMSVSGWAGHLQFRAHERALHGESSEELTHLLAIRMVCERALHEAGAGGGSALTRWKQMLEQRPVNEPNAALEPRRLWQRAHELAVHRRLFSKLADQAGGESTAGAQNTFQAVFCIDVRSEVFRRALEHAAPDAQTIGFAGFFGFSIESVGPGGGAGTPQCPVLLVPQVRVPPAIGEEATRRWRLHQHAAKAWGAFKASAVSSFVYVETAGLGFAAKLARDLTHRSGSSACSSCGVNVDGIPLETQADMAAGALRHMGFASGGLARLVLLCGHGSQTTNNPYGSSLDCGACGGHSGEANALTAATILNQPLVRAALVSRGIALPAETWFLAGLHNTTTDEVFLLNETEAPASHAQDLSRLKSALLEAGRLARSERAPALGLAANASGLRHQITTRAHDWSEVRPEWGLAGNHSFIAAPRARTKGLDLQGRVFLHDYNYAADEGEATLELLLAAPVVVASWINLQYFASTVDNQKFGSGNKVLHNVAGVLGVFEGNGGDLRSGLPFQSVHDGKTWRHDPLRLAVCVEAPQAAMNRVLAKHPEVSALVANRWIHLYALDELGCIVGKSDGAGGWI